MLLPSGGLYLLSKHTNPKITMSGWMGKLVSGKFKTHLVSMHFNELCKFGHHGQKKHFLSIHVFVAPP